MSVIFTAQMESDFTEWTSETDTEGDLNWSADAALAGTSGGAAFLIDNTTGMRLNKTLTTSTTGKIRLRFYFDLNSITMATDDMFDLLVLASAADNYLCAVQLIKYAASYRLDCLLRDDIPVNSGLDTQVIITDAPHYIEIYLQRATNSTSSDGSLEMWIDGTSVGLIAGKDNYDRFDSFARVYFGPGGLMNDIDAGTSGTLFLDEIIVNNDGGEIGGKTYVALGGTLTPDGGVATEYTAGEEGTQYTRSISRTLTPTGTIGKRSGKLVAGALSFEGIGDWLRDVWVSVGGTLTPDGGVTPLGALKVALEGLLTPAGEVARSTAKSFTGGLSSAGAAIKRAAKSFIGEITPGGVVANLKTYVASLAGEITPAGEIAKASRKPLDGALSVAGGIGKQIAKAFAGALSWLGALLTGYEAPSDFISLTIAPRNVNLTLESRSVDLALEARSVSLTIKERD